MIIMNDKKEIPNVSFEAKEGFVVNEDGTHYQLPCYLVEDGFGIVPTGRFVDLKFVRGSKLKDEEVERREGTLHEHLLSAMIYDLKFKSQLVPSRESDLAIANLEQALGWLHRRQVDRLKGDVVGTYQK